MTTTNTQGAADLLALIEAYAEARHRHGHSSYNAQSAAALKAVKEAMQETEATHLRELAAYRLTVENLEREIAAQQPAAQQGVAYATPEPCIDTYGNARVSIGDEVENDDVRFFVGAINQSQMLCSIDKSKSWTLKNDANPMASCIRQGNYAASAVTLRRVRASHGQAPAQVLHLVQDAFAEVAMAYPKAFALHKVGLADTAVRKALYATPSPKADTQPALDRARIREICMAHGFTVKEGQTDLKQYVYDVADALLRAARAQADSVLEDAALLHYALSDGGNQSMNWQDIFDDWDGDGYFIDALRAARKQGGA